MSSMAVRLTWGLQWFLTTRRYKPCAQSKPIQVAISRTSKMKDALDIALPYTALIASISPAFFRISFQLCASALFYVSPHSEAHSPHRRSSFIILKTVVLIFIDALAPPRLHLQHYSSPFGKISRPFPCKVHRSLCCLSCMEG